MITKVEGIVLSNIDYKESDIICQVLTREYGLISLIAKSGKKLSAKNRSCTMPFIKAEFIFEHHENKTMFQLQKADLIANYYIDNSIEKISAMNLMVDVIKKIVHDEDYKMIYDDFEKALINMANYESYYIVALFMIKISKLIGIGAYVDGCVVCDKRQVVAFSIEKGGFLCKEHAYEYEYMPLDKLKLIRMINKMDWQHLDYLKDVTFKLDDFDILMKFFFNHSDIKLKSFNFYRSLLSL